MAEVKQNSRKKKFIKDLGIYSIGVLGNRLITVFLIPFYTYFVEKSGEFGIYDLSLNISYLLLPLITLQMRDGMFRFLIDTKEKKDRQSIITFGFTTVAIVSFTTILFAVILNFIANIPYLFYTTALVISMSIAEVTIQTARGLGYNKQFVAQGLLTTFCIAVFSVIFVAVLKMNAAGIFLANIFARVVAIAFTFTRIKLISNYINFKSNFKKQAKTILNYTVPLIPTAMFMWLTTSCDRLFIRYFFGTDMNGIYAVAARFSGFITTLSIIFYQTWQENAIQQFHSKDRDRFFSSIFNNYLFVLAIILTVYSFILKQCYGWLVGASYQESVSLIYLSGTATLLYSIAAYFELPYQCAKDTKRAIPSVILSAVLNIIFNLILDRWIGIFGVIISNILSYTSLIIYRYFDTRRYFTLKIDSKTIIPLTIIFMGIFVYLLSDNIIINLLYMTCAAIVLIISAPADTKSIFKNRLSTVMKRIRH